MVELPFCVKFSPLYELASRVLLAGLRAYFYLFALEYVYIRVTSGDVGSGVAERDPQKNCVSSVDPPNLNK